MLVPPRSLKVSSGDHWPHVVVVTWSSTHWWSAVMVGGPVWVSSVAPWSTWWLFGVAATGGVTVEPVPPAPPTEAIGPAACPLIS